MEDFDLNPPSDDINVPIEMTPSIKVDRDDEANEENEDFLKDSDAILKLINVDYQQGNTNYSTHEKPRLPSQDLGDGKVELQPQVKQEIVKEEPVKRDEAKKEVKQVTFSTVEEIDRLKGAVTKLAEIVEYLSDEIVAANTAVKITESKLEKWALNVETWKENLTVHLAKNLEAFDILHGIEETSYEDPENDRGDRSWKPKKKGKKSKKDELSGIRALFKSGAFTEKSAKESKKKRKSMAKESSESEGSDEKEVMEVTKKKKASENVSETAYTTVGNLLKAANIKKVNYT